MKKIILSILTLTVFLFVSCSKDNGDFESIENSAIASIKGNKIEFTAKVKDLAKRFTKTSLNEGISVEYTTLEIRQFEDGDYALFAFNNDYTVKSACSLVVAGDNLVIAVNGGGTITCTSTDCSNDAGCTPYQKTDITGGGKYWTCTACSGKCTKTTSKTLAIEYLAF